MSIKLDITLPHASGGNPPDSISSRMTAFLPHVGGVIPRLGDVVIKEIF